MSNRPADPQHVAEAIRLMRAAIKAAPGLTYFERADMFFLILRGIEIREGMPPSTATMRYYCDG